MITDTAVMARRGLTLMARSPVMVAATSLMPVILMVLLSVSFGRMVFPGAPLADYIQYAAPLYVVMGLIFGGISTAVAAQQDRVSGFDDRLRTLPMSSIAPLAGRILADSMRTLVTIVVVTGVATILGFRFENRFAGALVYLAVALIFAFGMAWLMVAIAMVASSPENAVSGINALMLLLSFLSTGMVQLDDLPGWAQPVARINPVSHVVGALRDASSAGQPLWGFDAWITVLWAVGLTLAFGVLAVRGYRASK